MPTINRHLLPTLALAASLALTGLGWGEEKDEKLAIDQLPAAVKATLEKAAQGAKLGDIERETKKGKTVYTAEIPGAEKGTVIEFTVAEDGTLLKQETEKAGDHEDKDDEKGEHHGHHQGEGK